MSKYAFFIWSSYALTLAVFLWNALAPMLQRSKLRRRLPDGTADPDEDA
jgi:heme exporter protein CcmD